MTRLGNPPLPESIRRSTRWRWTRITLWLVGLSVTGLVCVQARQQPVAQTDYTRYHEKTFRVTRVVDGDTLDIDTPDGDKSTTRIRLWGVDTPEVARSGKPNRHFGPQASAFAKQTLQNKSVYVVLSPKRSRGKYGRLLAYVYLKRGGAMFNEMLLENGFAYADLRFKHHYYDRFQSIDKFARKQGAGLWKDVTLTQMPAWKQRYEKRKP